MRYVLAVLLLCGLVFGQGITYPPQVNGLTERDVTGTTATDTVLSSDCGNPVVYSGSVAVAVTLPTATSLGNSKCAFTLSNQTTGTLTKVTVTPTTWSISPAITATIQQGTSCRFTVNQAGSGWTGVCSGSKVKGTSALGTSAINSGACATVVTTAATGTLTTDPIWWGFNGDPTGVTGYAPTANGMLTIMSYPSADNVNFKVCNNTSASVTPGAITLNWSVPW